MIPDRECVEWLNLGELTLIVYTHNDNHDELSIDFVHSLMIVAIPIWDESISSLPLMKVNDITIIIE